MKNFILACVLAASATAHAQPAERCAGTNPSPGAQGACAKAPAAAPAAPPGPSIAPPPPGPSIGKAEQPEGTDPRQTPYKAGLRQHCDAMAQVLKPEHKLTPSQEAQVREQRRAFHC